MKHRLFTLVELLTVIAVIAILAGIAVPVVVGMQSKGRETSARADMNAIKMALTQFKADYSVWPQVSPTGNPISNFSDLTASDDLLIETPFDNTDTADSFTASIEAYDRITQSLTNNVVLLVKDYKPTDTIPDPKPLKNDPSGSDKDEYHYSNSKKKRYLDSPVKPLVLKRHRVDKNDLGYFKLDPWGRRYNIALDWNYDGKIDLKDENKKKFCRNKETKPILGQILIYSYGTAEAPDDTEAFLCSWKTNADK